MNEQRAKKTKYLNNQLMSDQDHQWAELKAILDNLYGTALQYGRADLVSSISKLLIVIGKNKPNKKLYKSLYNKINQIQQNLENCKHRATR